MKYPVFKGNGLIAAALLAMGGDFSSFDVGNPAKGEPKKEYDTPENILRGKLRAEDKRRARGQARISAAFVGGFPWSDGFAPRHELPPAPRRSNDDSSVVTRQQTRAAARRKSVITANCAHGVWTRRQRRLLALHSFRVNCRKNGPRGGLAAKQLLLRRTVLAAFGFGNSLADELLFR
jgi:hypothetical protein